MAIPRCVREKNDQLVSFGFFPISEKSSKKRNRAAAIFCWLIMKVYNCLDVFSLFLNEIRLHDGFGGCDSQKHQECFIAKEKNHLYIYTPETART